MVDPPRFQSKTYYNETGGDMNLNVTDLYVSDHSNFNNANANLDIHINIQNLSCKLTTLSERLKNIELYIMKSKSKSKHSLPEAADVKNDSDPDSIKTVYDMQNYTFLSKIANSVKNFQNSRQASKKDKINRCNFWSSSQAYTLQSNNSDDLCPSKCPNKGFCSLDFPNKSKNTSSRDKGNMDKNCPYQAAKPAKPAKLERQSSSRRSTSAAYEALAYVLEMLTDRTDMLLKRVIKLEGNTSKSNKKHQESIQATQVNCETVLEEVRKQKDEIGDMMTLLKNCSLSYKTLTTDFSELQSKLSKMSDDIQKILSKMDKPETKRPSSSGAKTVQNSVKLDRAKNSNNRSSLSHNSKKKPSENTNVIQDNVVIPTFLEGELSKQGGSVAKSSVTGSQLLPFLPADNQEYDYQTNENSLVDNSYIQCKTKTKRKVRCCDQKVCHSASPWVSADLTSFSESSFDMCTTCTNTTDCENYALLAGQKLIRKKLSQKSPKNKDALPASTTNKETSYVLCKCMGGAVTPQPPQTLITQKTQSVQVSSMTLGRSLMRSEPEDTQVIYTRSERPTMDTSVVLETPRKSAPVTKESKITQTKEKKKRSSCLCCSKKQKSVDSMEYTIQGKPGTKRDTRN